MSFLFAICKVGHPSLLTCFVSLKVEFLIVLLSLIIHFLVELIYFSTLESFFEIPFLLVISLFQSPNFCVFSFWIIFLISLILHEFLAFTHILAVPLRSIDFFVFTFFLLPFFSPIYLFLSSADDLNFEFAQFIQSLSDASQLIINSAVPLPLALL